MTQRAALLLSTLLAQAGLYRRLYDLQFDAGALASNT